MSARFILIGVFVFSVFSTLAFGGDAKPLMRDFLGINGHTIQFNSPLYAPLCRLVRDYHPYVWDVDDKPGNPTHFPLGITLNWKDQTKKFRDWPGPVDWNRIYGQWRKDGFEIDASIQFEGIPLKNWPSLDKNVYDYGKAFAAYCGPSHHNLVTSAEIGNEPAGTKQYVGDVYKTVLRNMSRGLREGDPKLKIVSGAVQFGKGDGYCLPIDVLKGEGRSYDIINLHQYAFLKGWPSFERTYPENPALDYAGILQKAIDWRNQNAAGKPIWITEFGFDSTTKGNDPKNPQWIGCTDLQQAQWIVRSYFVLANLDFARAYLYFFDDNDQPSLHASSGVTRHFEPKPSYFAMRHLYHTLGDYRLSKVIQQEPNGVYAFEFENGKDRSQSILVTWLATGSGAAAETAVKLTGTIQRAERMPTTDGPAEIVKINPAQNGIATLPLSESPLYVFVQK